MAEEIEVELEDPENSVQASDPAQEMDLAPEPPEPAPQISDLSRFLKHTRALLPAAVLGVFIFAVIAFLYFAKAFVMPVIVAVLLNFLLKPLVKGLVRVRIPQWIAALFVIGVVFGVLSVAVTRLVQPAVQWASKAPETFSSVEDKFHHWFRRAQRLSRAAAQVESMTKEATTDSTTTKVEVKDPVLMKTFFGYTKSFVAALIETVVLLFFMLAPGNLFMEKVVRVLPTLHDKKKAVEIVDELQQSVSTFLFTITIINCVVGTLVGLAAWALGLPNPALWGVLAGGLNFIPYFGPISGVAVLLVAGFITFDEPWRAALPSLVYLIVHAVESNIVTPWILGRRLTLNPLIIFISLMFWTWLWGIPGALLSIPMVMMLKVFCDHFKPLAPIGELLSGDGNGGTRNS